MEPENSKRQNALCRRVALNVRANPKCRFLARNGDRFDCEGWQSYRSKNRYGNRNSRKISCTNEWLDALWHGTCHLSEPRPIQADGRERTMSRVRRFTSGVVTRVDSWIGQIENHEAQVGMTSHSLNLCPVAVPLREAATVRNLPRFRPHLVPGVGTRLRYAESYIDSSESLVPRSPGSSA